MHRVLASLAALVSLTGPGCVRAARVTSLPSQVHLSWDGPTATTITVTWRSTLPRGEVRYAPTLSADKPATAGSVSARSRRYAEGYLHHARLTGLRRGTRYRYRCGAAPSWSEPRSFRTAPSPGAAFRFVVLGDSRSNHRVWRQVAKAALARNPAFVLHTGDLVGRSKRQGLWDLFFEAAQPLASRAPLLAALGNHEANSPRYFGQFALPAHSRPTHSPLAPALATGKLGARGYEPEAFYSFDYASLHVISLSTEPAGPPGGAQARWLARDLAQARANPRTHWIIAFGHRSPYSSGRHGDHLEVRRAFVPLLERHRVSLTFWGHDHNYERSKPLRLGKPVRSGGTTYIVTGGAGAPLYEVHGNARTAFAKKVHHFIEVNVSPAGLRVEARDASGKIFDRVLLKRDRMLPQKAPAKSLERR